MMGAMRGTVLDARVLSGREASSSRSAATDFSPAEMTPVDGQRVFSGFVPASALPTRDSVLACRGSLHVTSVATPARPPTAKTAKRSKVELIKEQSDYLRHPLMQASVQSRGHLQRHALFALPATRHYPFYCHCKLSCSELPSALCWCLTLRDHWLCSVPCYPFRPSALPLGRCTASASAMLNDKNLRRADLSRREGVLAPALTLQNTNPAALEHTRLCVWLACVT